MRWLDEVVERWNPSNVGAAPTPAAAAKEIAKDDGDGWAADALALVANLSSAVGEEEEV